MTPRQLRDITPDLVREALAYLSPDVDRDTWARVAMAIKSELPDSQGFALWDEWSQKGSDYNASAARDTWRSIKASGPVQIGTLFALAKEQGFRFSDAGQPAPILSPEAQAKRQRLAAQRQHQRDAEEAEHRRRADEAMCWAADLWGDASAAGESPYLTRKQVGAHGVRFQPDGTLLVPMHNAAGMLCNVQRIAPRKPTPEEEARGMVEKRYVKGGRKVGLWHQLGDIPRTVGAGNAPAVVLMAEGYATGATLYEATAYPVAVAFDGGNLVHVARELRQLLPSALLLVCGDDDAQTAQRTGKNPGRLNAAKAARAVAVEGAALAGCVFPEGVPAEGSDFNDLANHIGAEAGREAVRVLVAAAVASPLVPKPQRSGKTAAGQDKEAQQGPTPDSLTDEAPHPVSAPTRQTERPAKRDPFELLADGVYHAGRDRDGNDKPPQWLCAPLRVSAMTRTEDGNGWGRLLEFEDMDGRAKQWAMPSSLLSGESAEWAARLRDMGLLMAPGTSARNLVAQYIDTRTPSARVTCTDRVGWHPGGVYVLPSGSIGGAPAGSADDVPTSTEDAPRHYVFQSESGMEDTFRQAGTLQAWRDGVARLCDGNSRLMFAVCCALTGPLMRPAGIESGGFHFRGASSVGKTTALKVAASVWGRPTFMQRWRTTDNALEATAVQHCDCTLILDEIGQVDGKVVGDCAYLLANEQEKNRNTRSGMNRKRRTWRLLFLSSGEKSLAGHMEEAGRRVMAGQEVRMVDIPLDAGAGMGGLECIHDHDSPAALADAVTGAAARSYGTAGQVWLEWLAAHFATLGQQVAPLLERARWQMVPELASEQVRRVGTRFALVAAAGELAIQAGVLPWATGSAIDAARHCFNAWLGARGHTENFEQAAMLRQVRAYLETHGDALFTWMHRAHDDHRQNTPYRAGFKRWVDEEGEPIKVDAATDYVEKRSDWSERAHALTEFLVLPEAFKREVCKGFDPAVVAELLRSRGHLRHQSDRFTNKHRLPGMGPATVYQIKPSIFSDELG